MSSDPKDQRGDGNGASPRSGNGPGFTVHDRRFWVTGEGAEDTSLAGTAPRQPTYVEQLTQELEAARKDAAQKDQQLREYIGAYKEQVVHGLDSRAGDFRPFHPGTDHNLGTASRRLRLLLRHAAGDADLDRLRRRRDEAVAGQFAVAPGEVDGHVPPGL